MIRIFISTILYFITMLTQAHEIEDRIDDNEIFSSVKFTEENFDAICRTHNIDSYRFTDAKFEVKNKDLTFDIKL